MARYAGTAGMVAGTDHKLQTQLLGHSDWIWSCLVSTNGLEGLALFDIFIQIDFGVAVNWLLRFRGR